MAIPQHIRDRIGVADLEPVWRLTARTGYSGEGTSTDVTEQLLTERGPAISARTDLATAPARTLTVTSTERAPFDLVDPDAVQYVLEAGYRDDTGAAHYDALGAYFLDTQEVRDGAVLTNLASAEVQVIGKKNYKTSASVLSGAAFAAMQEPLAAHRFATFVRRALDAALPTTWDSRLGVFNTTNWQPGSSDDFQQEIGTDIWDAVTDVGTAAERRVTPWRNGNGWGSPLVQREPGTPAATIPRAICTGYLEAWNPREHLVTLHGRYTRQDTTGGQYQAVDVVGSEYSGVASRGEVVTMPGLWAPDSTSKRRAWLMSRRDALNTLVRQHTFTIPVMPWLEPQDTITITAPTGDTALMVSTISTDVVAGTMTITAREIL